MVCSSLQSELSTVTVACATTTVVYRPNMTSMNGDSTNVSREEEKERLHFQKITNAFRSYKKHSTAAIHKREEYMGRLPVEHQKLWGKHRYQDTMDDLEQNNDIIVQILKDVEGLFENVSHPDKSETDPIMRPGTVDMDKVSGKNIYKIYKVGFNAVLSSKRLVKRGG